MKEKPSILPRQLILSALVLRLFVGAFFFHPDIKSQHFHAQFLSLGVIDIYGYISQNITRLPYRDTFNYPPLTYYLLGGWNAVTQAILGPDFVSWLNNWGADGYFHPRMFEFMLILKLPYLLLDFLIGYLLVKINSNPKTDTILAGFWFFNPVSLYGIYMLSQFDVVCAALTVFALLQVKNRRLFIAAVALGLGTMIKTYPLLLFPLIIFRGKSFSDFISAVAGFLLGFILPLIPVIASPAFYYTMSHSNLMQRIFSAGIEIGGGQKLPIYVVIYFLTLWYSWNKRRIFDLLPEFLTVTLMVLLVSDFHAQWAVWSLPFLALMYARIPSIWPLLLAAGIGYLTTNLLLFDQYTLLGIFTPLNSLAIVYPPIPEMIGNLVLPDLAQSLAHTLLAGSGIWLIYITWENYDHR